MNNSDVRKILLPIRDYFVWVIRKPYRTAIVLLSIVMLGMNFLPNNLIDPFATGKKLTHQKIKIKKFSKADEFDKKIAVKFHTVDNLVLYVRIYAKDPKNKYMLLEDTYRLLKQRFVHAYSTYGMQENWIAVLAGHLVWKDLCAKVIPDDIMEGDAAACSQVSIIFMKACEQLGIPTRKVGLVGHYALEAFIGNQWYFFDADLKPDFDVINGHKSLDEILRNGEQYALYDNTILDSADIAVKFSQIDYGKPNAAPAPQAYLFHATTKIVSHWGWIVPLFFSFTMFARKKGTTANQR